MKVLFRIPISAISSKRVYICSFRWQVVVFYSGDWEEDSANAIKAFSSLAADFQ